MTDQIRKIANTARFLELYNAGKTRTEIARHYGCDAKLINRVVDYLGLQPYNNRDKAPSDEEEEFSRENLMLAPSIYAAAEQYRQRYEKRKEAETAQCTYNRQYKLNLRRSLS